jgi:hypothetical protein
MRGILVDTSYSRPNLSTAWETNRSPLSTVRHWIHTSYSRVANECSAERQATALSQPFVELLLYGCGWLRDAEFGLKLSSLSIGASYFIGKS